jgi:NAD-dependent SIR2 family protein deacetylase
VIENLENILKKAKKIVFLTGAGISQESGISTFRGKDGLWQKYDPMKLASVCEWFSHFNLYDNNCGVNERLETLIRLVGVEVCSSFLRPCLRKLPNMLECLMEHMKCM